MLTETGIGALKISCVSCSGYYTGDDILSLVLSQNIPNGTMTCQTKKQSVHPRAHIYSWCKSQVTGHCRDCPHGANCTLGIAALPNYWGYKTHDEQVKMVRCPRSYCNQGQHSYHVQPCSEHREGVLCGRCKHNYAEAFLSEICVPHSGCISPVVFLSFYISWILLMAVLLLLLKDIKAVLDEILKIMQSCVYRVNKQENATMIPSLPPELERETTKAAAVVSSQGMFKVTKSQTEEKAFDLKYFQIIMYYIQDASILAVNTPDQQPGEQNSLLAILFHFSELAFNLTNMAQTICVSLAATPVHKTIVKSSLGPAILFVYGLMFVLSCIISQLTRHCQFINTVYSHIASASVLVLLMFYQKVSVAALSLLQCVSVDNESVLLIDGTIVCYQMWQIGAFVFVFSWVIPFLLVLLVGPSLLEANKISVSEFFGACLLPVPVFCWWIYKNWQDKWLQQCSRERVWHSELVDSLQKPFKAISMAPIGPISWLGVIKFRRLVFVIICSLVSHLILRLALVTTTTVLFMVVHYKVYPYKDNTANRLYMFSLVATFLIGQINLIKAVLIEALVEQKLMSTINRVCEALTEIILLWAPVFIAVLFSLSLVVRKTLRFLRKHLGKGNSMELKHIERKPKARRASV